ncbi:plasmodesmata-located protein 8-like [Neltuma alba]|uniref:plasmodesmata-located protein 8-like n=1 Tax=Neltuma alba TaxID=207710 RepID=UPI0010A3F47A|nr:plasmodesmata-located protein 8-like [Prosopis alba]
MLRTRPLYSTHSIIFTTFKLSSLLYLFSSELTSHGFQTIPQTFIYAGCSQEKYEPNTEFESNLNSFLSSAFSSSSQFSYHSFSIGNNNESSITLTDPATIYGLYQCRGDLQPIDCRTCVETSIHQITLVCPYSFGAILQLEGCYLRYEHVDFLGKADTSLRFRRCRKPVKQVDIDFFRRRDAVVTDLLMAANNGFRVSREGFVEGVAMCLGDLRAADCSSCLGETVGKMKSLCGTQAAEAAVFLAQCYVHYRAYGYYEEASDSSREDRVRKATAILLGLLVALIILIGILSICQRAMRQK